MSAENLYSLIAERQKSRSIKQMTGPFAVANMLGALQRFIFDENYQTNQSMLEQLGYSDIEILRQDARGVIEILRTQIPADSFVKYFPSYKQK